VWDELGSFSYFSINRVPQVELNSGRVLLLRLCNEARDMALKRSEAERTARIMEGTTVSLSNLSAAKAWGGAFASLFSASLFLGSTSTPLHAQLQLRPVLNFSCTHPSSS